MRGAGDHPQFYQRLCILLAATFGFKRAVLGLGSVGHFWTTYNVLEGLTRACCALSPDGHLILIIRNHSR